MWGPLSDFSQSFVGRGLFDPCRRPTMSSLKKGQFHHPTLLGPLLRKISAPEGPKIGKFKISRCKIENSRFQYQTNFSIENSFSIQHLSSCRRARLGIEHLTENFKQECFFVRRGRLFVLKRSSKNDLFSSLDPLGSFLSLCGIAAHEVFRALFCPPS